MHSLSIIIPTYNEKENLKILDVDINFRIRTEESSKIIFKIIYFLGLMITQKFFCKVLKIFN